MKKSEYLGIISKRIKANQKYDPLIEEGQKEISKKNNEAIKLEKAWYSLISKKEKERNKIAKTCNHDLCFRYKIYKHKTRGEEMEEKLFGVIADIKDYDIWYSNVCVICGLGIVEKEKLRESVDLNFQPSGKQIKYIIDGFYLQLKGESLPKNSKLNTIIKKLASNKSFK